MHKFALALLLYPFLDAAPLRMDTVAGGKPPSNIPAQNAPIRASGTFTRDPQGNLVYAATGYTIQRIDADGTIEIVAGTGESGFSGDGGLATQARLTSPFSPRYDKAGNLYFADGFRIRRVDTNGIITTVIGTGIQGSLGAEGPLTSAQLDTIYGLEFDAAGNLYFAEPTRIRRITPNGDLQSFAAVGGGPMTIDSSGNLDIFDDQDVYRVAPDGAVKLFAGYRLTGIRTYLFASTAIGDSLGNVYAVGVDPTSGANALWRVSPVWRHSEGAFLRNRFRRG